MSIKNIWKIFGAALLLLLFSIYLYFFSSLVFPWQRQEVISITREWGGLAEFPKDASQFEFEKRGSVFSRQFIIEFEASDSEIEKWIENSKRLKDISPIERANKKTYEVYPGEKKSFGGKVEIEGNKVLINMSWS